MKRCGNSCPPIFGGKECREKVQCGCTVCAPLDAIDLSLAEACYKACNALGDARPKSTDEFLCKTVGPEELFNRYHLVRCGYDPNESVEAQQQKKAQDEITTQNKPLVNAMYVLFALIIIATLFLVLRGAKNKNAKT